MGELAAVLSDDPIMRYSGCDEAYFAVLGAFNNALLQEYGWEEGLELIKKYLQEDAELAPDWHQRYLDEMDAIEAAEEAYAELTTDKFFEISTEKNSEGKYLYNDVTNQYTGIEEVIANSQKLKANTQYYDITGRRLNSQPSKKGLYIVNGRKVIK